MIICSCNMLRTGSSDLSLAGCSCFRNTILELTASCNYFEISSTILYLKCKYLPRDILLLLKQSVSADLSGSDIQAVLLLAYKLEAPGLHQQVYEWMLNQVEVTVRIPRDSMLAALADCRGLKQQRQWLILNKDCKDCSRAIT